ncbi:MAG TPA: type I-C CRISPR-associated protein Cas8c/Csd1 [Bryobacteraceae bacterium]
MILHELKALALHEGLVADPAFEGKPVPWIIVLDEDGSYLGLRDTYQDVPLPEGKKGKPKRQAAMFRIPRRPVGKTSQDLSSHLVDALEYVVALAAEPSGKKTKEQMVERATKRHSLYVNDLKRVTPNQTKQEIDAVLTFFCNSNDLDQCRSELMGAKAVSGDLATFRVGGEFLHESPALVQAWREENLPKPMDDQEVIRGQCLVCGEFDSEIAPLHAPIKIPGGFSGGIPLVSAKGEAFKKYDLQHTAPVCKTCMMAYVEGMQRLVNGRYINPRTDDAFPVQNVRLSGDTTAVYWANIHDELVGTLSELMYSPQKVRDLLSSPHRGQRTTGAAERFFCLIVSGAQGRAMLRHMYTGTLGELEQNLNAFFDAIRLEGDRGEPKPLGFLLRSLVLQGKLDRLPPGLASEVFLNVLFGGELPRLVLSAAVQRNRAEQKVPPERAALLQLYFTSHKMKEVPQMSLNEVTTDAPYRLGRLLSAYEQLQRRAQGGNLNRTLVDRYFGAASTRPGTVFPQLVRLSQNHLGKLRQKGEYYQYLITGILDGIGSFPAMLTLEEQGRFALGYYHQRQAFFRGNQDKEQTADDTVSTSEGESNA